MTRLISLLLGATALLVASHSALAQEGSGESDPLFTEAETDRIRAEALAAILQYPEIIEEALAILEERRANTALAAVMNDPNTPVLGNPDSTVTLIEFFDYNCGYCRRVAQPLQDLLKQDMDLRLVMIETPILSEESLLAAQASLAVYMAGADYAAVHFDVMTGSGRASAEGLIDSALDLDPEAVTEEKLRQLMQDPSLMETITRNYAAMQAMDISGTPAFIVAGATDDGMLRDITRFPGAVPVEELRAALERIRAGS